MLERREEELIEDYLDQVCAPLIGRIGYTRAAWLGSWLRRRRDEAPRRALVST